MTEKKLPGADAHAFAYDCEGRVAFSRDGNQYRCGRRAFTLYDELGRIAVTGTCSDAADGWWMLPSSSRPVMSARRNGQASGANRWGIACGYDWDVQLADIQVLDVNYYDDYGFASDVPALSVLPTAAKYAPKGQPTGSLTAVLGNGGSNGVTGYLLSTSFYDSEERLLESRSQTVDGGLLYASTAYTVGGVPVQTRTQLSQGDVQLAYTNNISVDRHGRPLASVLSEGDNGPSWTLGAYTYNGIGRLSSVIAGGWLSRTMSYDIHGWLTYWESPYIFQTLYYGENGPQNATPSYSGLMTAKSTQVGEVATYTYSYDRMGRLTGAAYSGRSAGEDYSTTYSYDLQGNMLRMTRKGLTAPDSHGLVDDVTATYTGNQLHTLRDDAPEVLLEASLDVAAGSYSADAFDYDANGNLSRDMSRNITSMEYNGLNMPQRATVAGGAHIDWLYTATGQKLRQTVISAAGDTISRRDYVGPYLFTDRQFDRYLTAEGYITADSVYHAYIPDYQGNIVGVVNTAARHMDQFTEYYPYGLPFASSVLPDNNRYKFSAKELIPDLGFNASDFEARTLTHAFPAFSQPDPLAEKYHPLSPYIFCANNPINLIDPTGKDWIKSTGDRIYWYEGDYGDDRNLRADFKGTSGMKKATDPNGNKQETINAQNSKYQYIKDAGPTVEGKYKLNLGPEIESAIMRGGKIVNGRGKGIQTLVKMPDENSAKNNRYYRSSDWGTYRINLIPVEVFQPKDQNGITHYRDLNSFYFHDSEKGETHGCQEVETAFFNELIIYKIAGNDSIYVQICYPSTNHSTNGGTEAKKNDENN